MGPVLPGFTSQLLGLRRGISRAAGAVLLLLLVDGQAQAQRREDSYRPPAGSTSTLGQLNDGQPQGDPGSGSGYGNPSNDGGSGGYGQSTYGQPQTYGNPQGGPVGQAAPPYDQDGQRYRQQPYQQQPYANQGHANQGYSNNGTNSGPRADDAYRAPRRDSYAAQEGYGAPYSPQADQGPPPYDPPHDQPSDHPTRGYYSQGEIADAGRGFFGSITKGLASAIEYTYQNVGRPNGYLLGEDGGGAFFAGLRYGEGMLYTKDAGDQKVFWQGPSLGYDVGGEGSKIMVLVYNMTDPGDIYHRFGGIEGSTYLVGGVSVQLQKHDNVTLAIIRSGVGLRLGVNVGYLKYTREPTWNPF